ncbi:hypothetical protein BCV70DRAFT_196743 [Testicularia cyperi]|uniref:SH3 domain-containing protein n=1 Tax=Testicularia cyperi TaxID=1882483 RepID=A0A317XWL7_9BASI|nr:hypothetical protein BCV70DRAFT_196743 [Testicularia cyperi]
MSSTLHFPYLATATLKYKSPHKQDLTFAKGETIRVTGSAPKSDDDDDDDDDDWLVGESLDGSRQGTFPGSFVQPSDEPDPQASAASGAIPSETPIQPEGSVIETETQEPQADVVPAAAREAAESGATEQAGFGAPLPPRPPSPDADDDEEPQVPTNAPSAPAEGVTDAASQSVSVVADEPNVKSEPDSSAVDAAASSQTPEKSASVDSALSSGAAATTTAGAATVAAAETTSPSKRSAPAAQSPPAVSAKPAGMSSSFRDRIAAFNKPAEAAPPPVPKGKPGGWKRPTPAAAEKPLLPDAASTKPSVGISARPAPASASGEAASAAPSAPKATSPPVAESGGGSSGSFSAADAQSSIKMSLKERMAALRRQESSAAAAAPEIKPKPSIPGKIGADRRNVALQGMGLAAPSSEPVRQASTDSLEREPAAVETPAGAPTSPEEADAEAGEAVTTQEPPIEPQAATSTDEAAETGPITGEEEPRELTEEEQEAERRAAITKRMAALGARRMGGGPAVFGAPAPSPSRTKTVSSIASEDGATTTEPGIAVPETAKSDESYSQAAASSGAPPASDTVVADAAIASTTDTAADAEEEPKILAVPRRAAAPRKKRSPAPASAASNVVPTAADDQNEDATAQETRAAAPEEAALAETPSEGATVDGVAASFAAADAMDTAVAEKPDTASDRGTQTLDAAQDQSNEAAAAVGSDDINDADPSIGPANGQASAAVAEESDAEIAENQRQLEEYLRGEGYFEEPSAGAVATDPSSEPTAPEVAKEEDLVQQEPPQRESLTSPKPPSRPPSTRPPIPKTSLPPPPGDTQPLRSESPAIEKPATPAVETEAGSRRGSLIPPVPRTSLPVPAEEPELADAETSDAEEVDQEREEPAGPILAAPRPRMAMPTEDPEDEDLLAAADAARDPEEPAIGQTSEVLQSEEPAAAEHEHEQEQEEPVELTEEEQEAQRRANLARRMAALGGQRIGAFPGMAPPPIMGAPMPARKPVPQQPSADEQEEESTHGRALSGQDATSPGLESSQERPLSPPRGPPRGGMAIPGLTAAPGMNAQDAEGDALERARSPGAVSVGESAPIRLASPPPIPKSPPPPSRPVPGAGMAPVLPPGRPPSTGPNMSNLDEAVRAVTPSQSPSIGRSSSIKPPIPHGIAHSRNASATDAGSLTGGETGDMQPGRIHSPPLPATSPPPRPSSRAPPVPAVQTTLPPRRQGSTASSNADFVVPALEAPMSPSGAVHGAPTDGGLSPSMQHPLPPTPVIAAPAAPASTMSTSGSGVGARQSSRDLDLMPSSRWWRHGLSPLRLPPTVAGRPDAILYADTSSDGPTHSAQIYLLFEDYSTTVISLSFQDDDAEEAHTVLQQRHSFPPPKPAAEQLRQWSSQVGSALAKLAADAAKQSSSPVGDGSPRAFVQAMVSSIPFALPPVGHSLGAVILTQVGPTTMESAPDEVRPGDLVSCSQADFRGKRGLAPYHMTFGTQHEPTTAIVVECESKKNKLRCILQSPNNKKGLPDEVSLRLDDLKSGIVKVFRVPPRQGWVQDW